MNIFGKKNKEANGYAIARSSILASGTSFTGNITSDDSLRIESLIDGDIICRDKVIIGEKGIVRGSIQAKCIDIFGQSDGILSAEVISLRAGCKANGRLECIDLSSEPGASFVGNCETLKKGQEQECKTDNPAVIIEGNTNSEV